MFIKEIKTSIYFKINECDFGTFIIPVYQISMPSLAPSSH